MTIFKEEGNTNPSGEPQTPNPSNDNSFEDLLNEIKNEKGERKYSDLNAALVALKHSQEYIPEVKDKVNDLSAENTELKAQLDKLANLESVVQKLTAKDTPTDTPTDKGLDEQTVAELLESKLNQREALLKQKQNLDSVTSELRNKYGETAEKEFYDKATELGFEKEQFELLAKQNPKAVLKFFPEQKAAPKVTTGHNSSWLHNNANSSDAVEPSKQSVLAGASTKDLMEEFRKHKEAIYKKHGVQQ